MKLNIFKMILSDLTEPENVTSRFFIIFKQIEF